LRQLVGTDDLAQVATILDDERAALEEKIPGSSRWHYENRQVCSPHNEAPAECPKGQCITRQIERFAQTLRDTRSSHAQQVQAVQGLAHLIGDLHQPLHLADNRDRGGNDVRVLLPAEKKPRNLHEAWDTSFVRMNLRRRDERRYSASLSAQFATSLAAWRQGDVAKWAAETHLLADERAYRALPEFTCGNPRNRPIALPDTYIEQARATVEQQLAKAGVRLAEVLNALLQQDRTR
jgi:hypothetical protein